MPTRPPVHRPHFVCEPAAPVARHDALASAPALVRNPYDRNWEKLRAAFLARNPLCLFCLQAGRVTRAAEVDHIVEIAVRPDLRLEWTNLRALCKPCHSQRTARDVNVRRRQTFG